jgi:hypothetical protein
MDIKQVRRKFDRIDASDVPECVEGFSPRFVRGIKRVLGGDRE